MPLSRKARLPLQPAQRAAEIGAFEVMDVLARARALEARGQRVIHMEIGEPDFPTPRPVVEAARAALAAGRTAYTQALGLPELRAALAEHYRRRLGATVPASRIAITAGASGALAQALAALVNPGDRVLVPDPGYPAYRHFVRLCEGRARALNVSARHAFQPTLDQVRRAWQPETAGLIVGTPANPTGTSIARDELRRIAAFIESRGGWLLVDEIYQELSFDSRPRTAVALPGSVLVIGSFSKYFCMTGWRLGWAVLPEWLMRAFEKLAQHLAICAPTVAQYAALAALEDRTIRIVERRRGELARRRDFIVPALRRAGLGIAAAPSGAFYVYADCSRYAKDSRRFALELLEEEGVAATPGIDFGRNLTARHIRFAFTRPLAELEEAVRRIRRFCARR
jgi:aspartate/methionine/tyrosine aminotransferase